METLYNEGIGKGLEHPLLQYFALPEYPRAESVDVSDQIGASSRSVVRLSSMQRS